MKIDILTKEKEGKGMRRILLTLSLVVMALALTAVNAAAISGVCSNCHTMHNSQDGAPVDAAGPYGQLLNAGCVACHTASTPVIQEVNKGPAVLHTVAPGGQGGGQTLAGGDFYWVNANEALNASMGHNVIDLPGVTVADANMPGADPLSPPGWDPVATGTAFVADQVASGEATWSSQLTCAGEYGCHGNHAATGSFPGMQGAHHNNTGGTATQTDGTLTTIGESYRFLMGIEGLEEANWNWAETPVTHNEYYGEDSTVNRSAGGLAAYGGRDTISFLCAECHGLFHGTVDEDATAGSPWVRHPTDIDLPASGEYLLYNDEGAGGGLYSLEAPVARAVVPAASGSAITLGSDIVMCLSCHRAHGSPEPDLLRWTYSTMVAGGGATNGCFTCHTDKN